jgi:hypothetical protein
MADFDSSGWYGPATEFDYLNKSMSRYGYTPTHIVLHGTASVSGTTAENIANYFATSAVEASAHFIIDVNGEIVQGIPCSLSAWGNGVLLNPVFPFHANINPNYYTISIEHVKLTTDNSTTLTSQQQDASFHLIEALCNNYLIEKRRGDEKGGILYHADLDSVNRARCPGPYPMDELLSFLNGGTTVQVPNGWVYNSNTKILTAPNGIQVTNGFCQWILKNNWDGTDLPVTAALAMNPVEQGNPGLGGGTIQAFRTKVLAWTKALNVYEMWIGKEYVAINQSITQKNIQISSMQAQIVALQQQIKTLQNANVDKAVTSLQNLSTEILSIIHVLGK